MNAPQALHVTHIASGDLWAGAEVQLFTLCKASRKLNGVIVSVILLNHGQLEQRLKALNIDVTVLDETHLNGLQIGWRIIKHLRVTSPNIVHTHRIKENSIGGLSAWLNGIPSLRTAHGAPEHHPGWLRPHKRLLYLLDWIIGRYIQTSIIAVSDDLKILLETHYPTAKIKVIENGVDVEALTPYVKPPSPDVRPENRTYKIGLVGRLVPVKRVDIFINMAAYIRRNHPELKINFHIYGDGPLRGDLENMTKRLGLTHDVTFEGHTTDIYRQIASLDALLITSDHEGLPMTLLETMLIGVPVISRKVGGILRVCRDQNCYLVEGNSGEELAGKLISCLTNSRLTSETIKSASTSILKSYTADKNARQFKEAYTTILNNH